MRYVAGMAHKSSRSEAQASTDAETSPPMTGTVTVDGIEGKVARVELPDGTTADWDLASLPKGVKEGDVVMLHLEGGDLEMEIDHGETKRRREQAKAQMDALNQEPPAGEITL